MKIQFLGAAQTVTGSCYLIEAAGTRFAVDCGMHQGNNEIEDRNRNAKAYLPKVLDFILVTHAHIDHSGLLPRMAKDGFTGKVYVTPPTRDLLRIMLLDSAHIQEMESEWRVRKHKRKGGKARNNELEPLYTQDHAVQVMDLMEDVAYGAPFEPAPGIRVTYCDAGHILGSAFIRLEITEEGETSTLVFSGDIGRPNQLLVSDPDTVDSADFLFLESTYGNRDHKNEDTSRDELAEAIAYSYERGEKVIIPAFAVERTQEVIYSLYILSKQGKLPHDMPVFLDSPLAIQATEVFRKHPEFFDKTTQTLLDVGEDPFELPNLVFTPETAQSQAINSARRPAVVISASGMCNAGRIQHHLRHNLWREGASIVFVGFQGKGTPGRRIVDGAEEIRIFGEDVAVKARIFTIGGFSAHAGQKQLLDWLGAFRKASMKVFLVHGEAEAQKTLAGIIRERFPYEVYIPSYLEECVLEPGQDMEYRVEPGRQALPVIDWDYLRGETGGKLEQLMERMERVQASSWHHQAEMRDKVLEIQAELNKLLTVM